METIGLIAGSSSEELSKKLKEKNYKIALVEHFDSNNIYANYKLIADSSEKDKIISFFKDKSVNKVVIGSGYYRNIELAHHLINDGIQCNINPDFSKLAKDKIEFKKYILKKNLLTPNYIEIKNFKELYENVIKNNNEFVLKDSLDKFLPLKIDEKNIKRFKKINFSEYNLFLEEYIRGNVITIPVIKTYNNLEIPHILYYNKALEKKLENFKDEIVPFKLNKDIENQIQETIANLFKSSEFRGVGRIDGIYYKNKFYIIEFNSVIVSSKNDKNATYKIFKEVELDVADLIIENAIENWKE